MPNTFIAHRQSSNQKSISWSALRQNYFLEASYYVLSIKVWEIIEILSGTFYIQTFAETYLFFINCYLNYGNIVRASTNKNKLRALYCLEKYAARAINFKDKFTSAKLLLGQINTMAVYETNIYLTLYVPS